MQSVEIERLLQWAFREELPKRYGFGPRGPQSAWQIAERHARLGCLIQASHSATCSAIPHRDALLIADEVAGLRGCVAVDLRLEHFLGDFAPLADQITTPQISLNEADLVESHARAGVSPNWCRYLPKAAPVIGPNGKQKICGKRYGKDRYSEGAHCPLRWGNPTIESIARARAEYTIWRGSLDRLAKTLNGKLKHYTAAPPAALQAPWARPH
jgi:hypothetical protein